MKNITVLTALVIIIGVLPANAPAFGQDMDSWPYTLGVSPRFGMLYGQAKELVYPGTFNKGELLSELLWDMKPLWYYGIALDFSRRDPLAGWGFFANAQLKAGIPGDTGQMEDRDWQSYENSDLTNYSVHDNETNQLFWVEGGAGLSVPIKSLFLLKLSANVSYMRFSFTSRDGSATYAREDPPYSGIYNSINDNPKKYTFSGKVITYAQDWLLVAPGIGADFRFLNRFSAELFFQMSPLIWCADKDEHLLTGYEFRDYAQWGLFLEPRGKIGFTAARWLELSLDLGWRHIFGSKGPEYARSMEGGDYSMVGEAGAGLSLLDAGLLVKIRL